MLYGSILQIIIIYNKSKYYKKWSTNALYKKWHNESSPITTACLQNMGKKRRKEHGLKYVFRWTQKCRVLSIFANTVRLATWKFENQCNTKS